MPRSKYTAIEKLDLIDQFHNSGLSYKGFARTYGLGENTIKYWISKYNRDGIDGLSESKKNNHYSKELKLSIIKAYLAGTGTIEELSLQYGLRSHKQLTDWLFKYNRDKTLASSPSRKQDPTMSRKTTFEERIKIVEYVTISKHSYAEAAETFQVSYQQVRSWALKSNENGYDVLIDNRGHRKLAQELTDLDKANLRIRQLEGQVADMKLMEEFVKKLKELQHRGEESTSTVLPDDKGSQSRQTWGY